MTRIHKSKSRLAEKVQRGFARLSRDKPRTVVEGFGLLAAAILGSSALADFRAAVASGSNRTGQVTSPAHMPPTRSLHEN